jgi:glutathione peroxidase-family protein
MSIYDLSFTDNNKNIIKLKQFEGKDILIVNTASYCGYTSQYADLQKAQNDSLVVIGFPCNQFGNQEPGTNEEIKEFCTSNFGITFSVAEKIYVNGPDTHPIYKYCKDKANNGKDIAWNFEKFLISTDGSIKHYPSSYQVADIINKKK